MSSISISTLFPYPFQPYRFILTHRASISALVSYSHAWRSDLHVTYEHITRANLKAPVSLSLCTWTPSWDMHVSQHICLISRNLDASFTRRRGEILKYTLLIHTMVSRRQKSVRFYYQLRNGNQNSRAFGLPAVLQLVMLSLSGQLEKQGLAVPIMVRYAIDTLVTSQHCATLRYRVVCWTLGLCSLLPIQIRQASGRWPWWRKCSNFPTMPLQILISQSLRLYHEPLWQGYSTNRDSTFSVPFTWNERLPKLSSCQEHI